MAVTYPSFNAIRNAGGEYGEILPTPWHSNTPDGVQRSQITEAYSGHNALVFDPVSNGDQMIQHLAHPSYLWQGKTYFIRFWIKRKGNPGGAPTITVSLQKEDGSGNTLSAKTSHSITLGNGDWTLFEATINTHGGQYYSWNDRSYTSKIVLSSNRSDVDYLIDEMYLESLYMEMKVPLVMPFRLVMVSDNPYKHKHGMERITRLSIPNTMTWADLGNHGEPTTELREVLIWMPQRMPPIPTLWASCIL